MNDARRLLLCDDAHLVPTEDGMLAFSHRGGQTLPGRSLADWVDRLAPFLNGRHTRAEITAALPDERRQVVERILDGLLGRGLLREVGDDEPDGLSDAEREEYRHELAYVRYVRDSAGAAFERYRRGTALVVGSGSLLPAAVGAALRSGSRTVRVRGTGECSTDAAWLDREIEAELARDGDRRVLGTETARVPLGDPYGDPDADPGGRGALAGADLVVHVSDRPMPTRARLLERLCAEAGAPLVQAMVHASETTSAATTGGAEVWCAGPGVSWASGWRRRSGLRARSPGAYLDASPGTSPGEFPAESSGEARVDPSALADAHPVPSVTATVVASQLLHGAFRRLTGVDEGPHQGAGEGARPRRHGLVCVDARTLAGTTHSFREHPLDLPAAAESTAAFLARMTALARRDPLDPEEFSRRAALLMDAELGAFGAIDEGDADQLPLHFARTEVADPMGLLAGRPLVVTGSGRGFAAARHRTALNALATYGSLAVDPRRLCTAEGEPLLAYGDEPSESWHEIPDLARSGWVHGVEADTDTPILLPTARVFPALAIDAAASGNGAPGHGRAADGRPAGGRPAEGGPVEDTGYAAPVGTAAGLRWSEAVRDGLLQHAEHLTVAEANGAELPRALDPVAVADDPTLAYCHRMLTAMLPPGRPLTVHDITGSLRVPTVACTQGGGVVAYGSGLGLTDAIRDGLWRSLLWFQTGTHGGSGSARGQDPLGQDAPLRLADVAAALRGRFRTVAVVPLDHDPEVHAMMPFVVRVVVADVP